MRASDITLEWLQDHLEGFDWDESSSTGMAWCPCHDDVGTTHKGLSITRVGKKFLLYCNSPHCRVKGQDVVNYFEGNGNGDVSVTVRKKSEKKGEKPKAPAVKQRGGMAWWVSKTCVPESIWENLGCEEDGNGVRFTFADLPIYKYRKPPKEFGWEPKSGEVPPLWPIPMEDLPEHVTLVEGESDAGTAHAGGLPFAFAITKGAGTDLPDSTFRSLAVRGVSEVTLIGDTDSSGNEFVAKATSQAVASGLSVNVVHLDQVLDPFSGINDLNGLWRECEADKKLFGKLVHKATQRVATRFPTISVEEMLQMAKEEVNWIIPNLIAPSDKVIISGPQKSYKTWILLDIARSLSAKQPFLNRSEWLPEKQLNVLLVEQEGSPLLWARRIEKLNLPPDTGLHFLHRAGIFFTESETIDEVIGICKDKEIDVLMFDPLQRLMPGVDENDASATGIVWDQIFRIQQALPHLVVLVVHHSNKSERLTWESIRGSSRHAGEVDLGLFVQKLDDGVCSVYVDGRDIPAYLGTGESFEVKIQISQEGERPKFTADASEVIVQVKSKKEAEASKNRDTVLNLISEGVQTVHALVSQADMSERTIRTHLKTLTEDGKVKEIDHGPGKTKTYCLQEDDTEEAS